MFTTDRFSKPLRPETNPKELTRLAIRADEAPELAEPVVLGQWHPADLGDVWSRLVAGELVVSSHHNVGERCFLQLSKNPQSGLLSNRRVEILERVLLGEPSKVVASDLMCAASTLSSNLRTTLQYMGIDRAPYALPMFLVVLSRAARGALSSCSLRAETAVALSGGEWLALDRVECTLPAALSHSERDVVSGLIEGDTYNQIAAKRHTAMRTVANQIANAYTKLGVSGRMELLDALVAARVATPRLSRSAA